MNETSFSFILLADTHIRATTHDPDNAYPSDPQSKSRVEYVVKCIKKRNPKFVIHLGDITHPLPSMPHYEGSLKNVKEVFKALDCPIYYVAGNHDTCDKANAFATAPTVDEHSHKAFEKNFNTSFFSFDFNDYHFVILDSTLFNSGLKQEKKQKAWLLNDLKTQASKQIFWMMHYPLFTYSPTEEEHYDNVGLKERKWLLNLIKKHGVKAVFSGHSHYFFFNRYHHTPLYTLPSTTFVRPDFSDSLFIGPTDEFGRNDTDKLGFFEVHVKGQTFEVEPVRTFGLTTQSAPEKPVRKKTAAGINLGFQLRHNFAKPIDLPCDSLDELNRKAVRNDYFLYALLETPIRKLKLPLLDLKDPIIANRIEDFSALGFNFFFFTASLPSPSYQKWILSKACKIKALELILTASERLEALSFVKKLRAKGVSVYLSNIKTYAQNQNDPDFVFTHFLKHGFKISDADSLASLKDLIQPQKFSGVVFTIEGPSIKTDLNAIHQWSQKNKTKAVVLYKMPRLSESKIFDNDTHIAACIQTVVESLKNKPKLELYFDTFMDHDRGYNPRHGFLDRRGNLREAFNVLKNELFE